MNNNNFFWSIQKESYDFTKQGSEYPDNLVLKSNDNNDYYGTDSDNNNNSMVSMGDVIYDSQLRENIKSVLCQNFISNDSNKNVFSNLLKQKIGENK